jgi:hypothetical protein
VSKSSWRAGEEIILDFGPVTRTDDGVTTPIGLRTNGTKLRFMAKRSRSDEDAAAEIDLNFDYTASVATQNGVFVPDTPTDNEGFVLIPESATADIMEMLYLEWELRLQEPTGRTSVVDYGELAISPAVVRAPF